MKMIVEKDAIFREGELELIALCQLTEEQSLDKVIEIILTKGEEWLQDLPIDKNTLLLLRNNAGELHSNIHQFHFNGLLKSGEKKESDKKEKLSIQTGLQLLSVNQPLATMMIQGMPDEIPESITDAIHGANEKRLNDMKTIITNMYIFYAKSIPKSLQSELKRHIIDLERMFKIICRLPKEIKKGRYPNTCSDDLHNLRNQRDKWLRFIPSVMTMSLEVEYAKKGKNKRRNKVL